jgi:hypothetical protein
MSGFGQSQKSLHRGRVGGWSRSPHGSQAERMGRQQHVLDPGSGSRYFLDLHDLRNIGRHNAHGDDDRSPQGLSSLGVEQLSCLGSCGIVKASRRTDAMTSPSSSRAFPARTMKRQGSV